MHCPIHGRPQAWARWRSTFPWKRYKVFIALVVTVKRSVGEICVHYFHNLSVFLDPAGGLSSQAPNLLTSVSNPTGAHGPILLKFGTLVQRYWPRD